MTATMEQASCNVIYVDRRAKGDRMVQREDSPRNGSESIGSSYVDVSGEHREVTSNLQALLSNFKQGKRFSRCQPVGCLLRFLISSRSPMDVS
jgi:hypothetical protein